MLRVYQDEQSIGEKILESGMQCGTTYYVPAHSRNCWTSYVWLHFSFYLMFIKMEHTSEYIVKLF